MTKKNNIKTENIYPPVPFRSHDWRAYIDGQEEGATGWGETEDAAIKDLMNQLDEDSSDYLYTCGDRGIDG